MDCILLHLSYGSVCKVVPELFCWISADTRFRQLAALIISAFSTLELRLHTSNNGFWLFFCRLLNFNSRFLFICAFSLNSCKIFFNCKLMLVFSRLRISSSSLVFTHSEYTPRHIGAFKTTRHCYRVILAIALSIASCSTSLSISLELLT